MKKYLHKLVNWQFGFVAFMITTNILVWLGYHLSPEVRLVVNLVWMVFYFIVLHYQSKWKMKRMIAFINHQVTHKRFMALWGMLVTADKEMKKKKKK